MGNAVGPFDDLTGFQWDDGNAAKNQKHSVTPAECEQVFFRRPALVFPDLRHSGSELRYFLLGRTDGDRELFVVFTRRSRLIRVISARPMNRREREIYRDAKSEEDSDL
jgi:hypothetical protein